MADPIWLYDLTLPRLQVLLNSWGFATRHATALWGLLYHNGPATLDELSCASALPRGLKEQLQLKTRTVSFATNAVVDSDDGLVRKYRCRLADGSQVEAVMICLPGRNTACLSTQAGCALGCTFCATGQAGFVRNLTAGEIVVQALCVAAAVQNSARNNAAGVKTGTLRGRGIRLRNLVLMGMGEALLNYDAVMTALEILREPSGLAIGAKRITISTVGVIPGIIRLADEGRPYSLAVSLHAATQTERLAIIPTARTWPLDELITACQYYVRKRSGRIFFEWTLIHQQNDSEDHARTLAELLTGIPAHVNLIPLNATPGYHGTPTRPEAVTQFQTVLRERGIPSTVRRRRGVDISAGCGQLAGSPS